jgi:hypothetical protein
LTKGRESSPPYYIFKNLQINSQWPERLFARGSHACFFLDDWTLILLA